MGLPQNWRRVMSWLTAPTIEELKLPEKKENDKRFSKKFPDIPTLATYGGLSVSKEYWANFPSNPIPPKPETRIDVKALKTIIESCSPSLLKSEQQRARKCVEYLGRVAQRSKKGL